MTPAATRDALVVFLAYAALFVVTLQRVQELRDVERLLRWVAISALVMGGFGLVQLLTSNGKFFWFYEHPFADTLEEAKGSFTNRNHFAHFLALGIGPLIWWLQETLSHPHQRRPRGLSHLAGDFYHRHQGSGLRAIALGVVLFAGLLSLSRGGVSVMFLAAAISVAVCYRAKTLGIRFVLSLGAVGLLIAALLTIHGYDRVSDRLDDLGSGSIDAIDHEAARRTIWAADLKASRDYALLGAGVGSHVEVCPMYLDEPQETEYTHAENGPLQVLLETGSIGLTLMLAGVGICMFWCLGACAAPILRGCSSAPGRSSPAWRPTWSTRWPISSGTCPAAWPWSPSWPAARAAPGNWPARPRANRLPRSHCLASPSWRPRRCCCSWERG